MFNILEFLNVHIEHISITACVLIIILLILILVTDSIGDIVLVGISIFLAGLVVAVNVLHKYPSLTQPQPQSTFEYTE